MENEERKQLFEDVVLAHRTYLERFIITICNDPELANDIMQEVLVAAWRKLDMIAHIEGNRAHYLCSIAKNTLRNYYRTKKRHFDEEVQENPGVRNFAPNNVVKDVLEKDARRELLLMMGNLRKEYAQILILYYYYDYSFQEIASVLNLKYNTVISWHYRAKKALAVLIQEEEERGKGEYGEFEKFGTTGEWEEYGEADEE